MATANDFNTAIEDAAAAIGNVLTNDSGITSPKVTQVIVGGKTTQVPATGTITVNGIYGQLTIAASGAYTYTLWNASNTTDATKIALVQSLTAGQSVNEQSFQYIVNNTNTNSFKANLNITVKGVNDIPTISGVSTGTVAEDGTLTASGTLTVADRDCGQSSARAVAAGTASTNGYGTYSVSTAGLWTYTLNNANAAVQALDDNETLTDTITVKSFDGTATQTVTITISGTNDAPAGLTFNSDGTFSYTVPASAQGLDDTETSTVTFQFVANDGTVNSEAKTVTITINGANDAPVAADGSGSGSGSGSEDDATISGSVSATDVDVEALTYSVSGDAPEGLTFNSDGTFSYVVPASAQELDDEESTEITFQYVANDGTVNSEAKTVNITINGANDAPVAAAAVASATEGGATVTSNVVATDIDVESLTYSLTTPAAAGLTFNADGSYSFDPTNAAYNHLAANATQQVEVGYKANDGTVDSNVSTLTITVTGTNDAAGIGGTATGSVTEDTNVTSGNLTASGSLTVVDPDDGESFFTAQSGTAGNNGYGTFSLDANGGWTYKANNSQSGIQNLAFGQSATDSFTAVSKDGTASQTVTVTIHGQTDVAAVFTGTGDPNDGGTSSTGVTTGGIGNDNINGCNGNDTVYGRGGNDQLGGGAGNDTVYGGSGNDTLTGGGGTDTLIGGYGADLLIGGGQADTFKFLDLRDTGDTIGSGGQDFFSGTDKIDLSAIDANSLLAGDQPFSFNPNSQALVANGVNWFTSGGNTIVQADTDGNLNTAEFQVTLIGNINLVAGDFVL